MAGYKEVSVLQSIRSQADLDSESYLAANPDVRGSGMSAQDHFAGYGRAEGRKQFAPEAIRQIRAEKLRDIAFNRPPSEQRPLVAPQLYVDASIAATQAASTVPVDYSIETEAFIQSNKNKIFLDIGSGLRNTYSSNVVNVDIVPLVTTDIVCDAQTLPFADDQFDHVFCLAVLHHLEQPWLAIAEMLRVLKPGGTIRIDWPFLQPVHGGAPHYFNATPGAVLAQFAGRCEIVSADVRLWQHPAFALKLIMDEWHRGLAPALRDAFAKMTVGDFLYDNIEHIVRLPVCADLPVETQRMIASGSTLVARKNAR